MNYFRALLLAAAAALAACQPGGAGRESAAASSGPPVATVNGTPISSDLFDFYLKNATGKEPSELTAEQREQALDNLVRAQVVAQKATKDGLAANRETAAILELQRLNVLQQAASEEYLKDKQPTEQELRAEYEAQVAALPQLEYHARHILVATEPFAEKLVARLKKGEDFAELAKRESMDSSKENGGDLGWFTPDRMVPAFSQAVVALKPGEITPSPVQTQYGWHVIKLEDTRELTPPPFEQVRERLEPVVRAKKFKAYVDELMKTAKVDKPAGEAVQPAPAEG